MRNKDVAKAFVSGKTAEATAGNLRTDGQFVFSYGDRIASWVPGDEPSIRIYKHFERYAITGRHIRIVQDAVYAAGYEESPEENTQDWEVWR